MKNREELYNDLQDHFSSEDYSVAVEATTYAIIEYIDDAIEQWGETPVVGQVLFTLRNNIAQFAGR